MRRVETSLVIASALIGALISVYITFVKYRPQNGLNIEEVSGAETTRSINFPIPEDSQILGIDKNANGQTINIRSAQSPEDIQKFYKNIFLSKGWKIEYEGRADIFYNSRYKKGKDFVTITSSLQVNSAHTIAIIDFRENP
ncbi:hypothetical protein HYW61_00930 [candidate division WWE3 bacterium]|nr:hypothetical protein [candidate division WWE3 bacterium]